MVCEVSIANIAMIQGPSHITSETLVKYFYKASSILLWNQQLPTFPDQLLAIVCFPYSWVKIAKILVMKKATLLSVHSHSARDNNKVCIRLRQILSKPQISLILLNMINYRVRHAWPQYSNMMQSKFEWKANTVQTIFSFHVWTTDAINFTESTLAASFILTNMQGLKTCLQ